MLTNHCTLAQVESVEFAGSAAIPCSEILGFSAAHPTRLYRNLKPSGGLDNTQLQEFIKSTSSSKQLYEDILIEHRDPNPWSISVCAIGDLVILRILSPHCTITNLCEWRMNGLQRSCPNRQVQSRLVWPSANQLTLGVRIRAAPIQAVSGNSVALTIGETQGNLQTGEQRDGQNLTTSCVQCYASLGTYLL